MSKQCIRMCPRLMEHVREMGSDNFLAAIGPIHPDMFKQQSAAKQLLGLCEQTYDCAGPGTKQVDVEKGFWRKTTVSETQTTCGLDT